MNETLWTGVDVKLESAYFFLEKMHGAIIEVSTSRRADAMTVVQLSTGADMQHDWQTPFYANLDAFLAMVRSIPDIIRCCFGVDMSGPMKPGGAWFKALPVTEQDWRRAFFIKFEHEWEKFKTLPLTNQRNITLHRTGMPSVVGKIAGRFGVYESTPGQRIGSTEINQDVVGNEVDILMSFQKAEPLLPKWTDFEIGGEPLFEACNAYLQETVGLVTRAREYEQDVNRFLGNQRLTPPSSEI